MVKRKRIVKKKPRVIDREVVKKQLKNAQQGLTPIKKQIAVIAKERDKLRAMLSEYNEIIENLDFGTEQMEGGLSELDSGLDTISQLL